MGDSEGLKVRNEKFAVVGMDSVVKAFVDFNSAMERAGEPYFLIGGTLLSLVRQGRLFDHDKDIDIGIPDEAALYRIADKMRAAGTFDDVKVTGVRNGKTLWLRRWIGDDKQIIFELQAHYRAGNNVYYNRPMGPSWKWRRGHCLWPNELFAEYGKVEAYGKSWPTPSPVRTFLSIFYGTDWEAEKRYTDWRYNCPNLSEGWLGAEPVVMVAGATRGIGEYVARHLAGRGCKISACGRSAADGDEGNFLTMKCDLKDEMQIVRWVDKTLQKFGYVDALVYNAGKFRGCLLLDSPSSELDELYAVMVRGYYNTLRHVLPVMVRQADGYVINIGSTRSVTAAPYKGFYSAAKHAAAAITDTVNQEHNTDGVWATNANFGIVYTQSTIELYGDRMREIRPAPIGMDDVAATVDYLMSLSRTARPRQIVVGGKI